MFTAGIRGHAKQVLHQTYPQTRVSARKLFYISCSSSECAVFDLNSLAAKMVKDNCKNNILLQCKANLENISIGRQHPAVLKRSGIFHRAVQHGSGHGRAAEPRAASHIVLFFLFFFVDNFQYHPPP